jgi:arsenate reductase (thioredoxin)
MAGKRKKLSLSANVMQGRSRMAGGFLNAWFGDRFLAYSAGISPSVISPLTIRVMKESGIDVSHQTSRSLETFRGVHFGSIVSCAIRNALRYRVF